MNSPRCTHACDQPTVSAEHLTPFSLGVGKAASHSAWSSGRKVSLPRADGLELGDFEVPSNYSMIYSRLLPCMKQVVCYKLAYFLIFKCLFLIPIT